jgi:hypothetical protein
MCTSLLLELLITSIFTIVNSPQSKPSRTLAVGTDIKVNKKESLEKKISIELKEHLRVKKKNRRSFILLAF